MIKALISSVLTFLTIQPLVSEALIKPSIVGGTIADSDAYPWMVALVRLDRDSIDEGQFCGGMLIHPLWILTAAHCIDERGTGPFEVAVSEGDLNGEVNLYQTGGAFIHPEADQLRAARSCDIALIRLRTPITDVKPVALQRAASVLATGRRVKTLGWGRTSYTSEEDTTSAILREVDAIISEIDGEEVNRPIYDYFVKTEGLDPIRGTYNGDSGGPMLIQNPDDQEWQLAGVTSFGRRNIDENQNANYFTKIAYAAPWIDSFIAHPFSLRPDIKPVERIVPGIIHDGVPKVGYKFWPFADGPMITMQRAGAFYLPGVSYFRLDDRRHIYNDDGSFIFVDQGFSLKGQITNSSIMQLRQQGRLSFGNPPIPLTPFNRMKGSSPSLYELTMDKEGQFFILQGVEAGKSYTYPYRGRLYAAKDGKIRYVDSTPGNPVNRSPSLFTVETGTTYFVGMNELTPGNRAYDFGILPSDASMIAVGGIVEGTLSSDSHLYKNEHTRAELLQTNSQSSGELRLELYSDFDAELQLVRTSNTARTGYFDIASEEETEIFILSANDFQAGRLLVYNFDKDVYGDFTARLYNHSNPALSFDTELQYAVTDFDRNFTSNSTRETYHYEHITFRSRPGKDHTKVKTYVPYANLGVAVYHGDELLDFHFGESSGEIEFASEPNSEYKIYVYDFEDYRNVNFKLTVSDSVGSTLSGSSSRERSEAFPQKANAIRLKHDRASFEQLLREHEAQRAKAIR